MTRNVLVIAALAAAVSFSVSGASAAPTTNALELLKSSASESNLVEQARHRHRRVKREKCWWGDRWLCRHWW